MSEADINIDLRPKLWANGFPPVLKRPQPGKACVINEEGKQC